VQLWLDRYILPICAAIVSGIVILNPLKQQRLFFVVAISSFAAPYISLKRPPKAKAYLPAAIEYPLPECRQSCGSSAQIFDTATTAETEKPQFHRLGNKSLLRGVRLGYTCTVDSG